MPIFSQSEMERRAAIMREGMTRMNLDAVIATSYAGSYYLSGAPIHPFGRPMATVLPLETEPVLLSSIIELAHVQGQTWIGDQRHYWDFGLTPTVMDPQPPVESLVQLLGRAVRDRGLERARLGIEEEKLPVALVDRIQAELPHAELVGCSALLDGTRMVLSEEELALVRAADAVADLGQERLIELLAPAVSARDLVDEIRVVMVDAILEHHPGMPFHLHVSPGLGSPVKGSGHSEWTPWNRSDTVRDGQLLETVISVWLWGYWGNVERAVWVGEPTTEIQEAFAIMVEANEAAISAVEPGVPLADVDRAAKRVLARHGHTTRSGTGCGRGITSYEADARELRMDLRPYADAICAPGMAFSIEPDLEIAGVGTFRHCNTVIVTETGREVSSRLPRGMITIQSG
jgi:Xaa-Pro dipeptidase